MVVHTSNCSTGEAEANRSLWVQGQPNLHSEFQDSKSYRVRICLKRKKKRKIKQNKAKTLASCDSHSERLRQSSLKFLAYFCELFLLNLYINQVEIVQED